VLREAADFGGRPGGPLPLCGAQIMVDIVDATGRRPPLLPALGQVRRTAEVAQRINNSVEAAGTIAVPRHQGNHNLA